MTNRRVIGLVVAGILLAACNRIGPGGGGGGGGGAPDLDGAWQLETGTHHGTAIEVPADTEITMEVDGSEIGGRAACNLYGGTIERDGAEIGIGALSVTEMACAEPIMAAESAYLAALGDVTTAERAGDRLTLSGPEVELTYALVPPVEDAELEGTRWVLESLISGDAASSVLGDPATLEFADDGTFSGFTGCRTFEGSYTRSGDMVAVSQLTNDDRGCAAELNAQDEHVLAVLSDGFEIGVDGERLTLTDGELGLDYRVADA